MIKFIDLFAGTGGIRLGFEQACKKFDLKTECVFSSEIDKNACASYELNFGHNPYSDSRFCELMLGGLLLVQLFFLWYYLL